ncbi:MAG: hypothetical protein ABJN95_18460 [Maribacter sp.]|uniref:hypothetical protein n=1 Tax=Maribacter sp. TaxID=1897614 RepID=UPI003297F64D
MIVLFKHRWNRVAVRIASLSFLIGTVLMLTALMSDNELIITFGIVFLVLYLLQTIIILFILLVNTMAHFRDIHEHVMTLIIVLMNFPIAVLYINFLNP